MIRKVEALEGVLGVIIGRSYGGKSLGRGGTTGTIRVQREISGGLKAVTQTAKGVQELFIRMEAGCAEGIWEKVRELES